jgi:putative spermidine/putrescine transport system ATP-binding protein
VYERPATSFVAGFVGVSNTLSGEAARAVTGTDQPITIRPEKIHLLDEDAVPGPDEASATGEVRDVVYLGAVTRYIVGLDAGGVLVVLQQNLRTSSMQVLEEKGRRVRLAWSREFSRAIHESDGGAGASSPGEEGE